MKSACLDVHTTDLSISILVTFQSLLKKYWVGFLYTSS